MLSETQFGFYRLDILFDPRQTEVAAVNQVVMHIPDL